MPTNHWGTGPKSRPDDATTTNRGFPPSVLQADVIAAAFECVTLELLTFQNGAFQMAKNYPSLLIGEKDDWAQLKFFADGMKHALAKLQDWFYIQDEVLVTSAVLSVDYQKYLGYLERIRQEVFEWQTDLAATSGDQVILINTQIGPILSPPSTSSIP